MTASIVAKMNYNDDTVFSYTFISLPVLRQKSLYLCKYTIKLWYMTIVFESITSCFLYSGSLSDNTFIAQLTLGSAEY